VTASRRGEPCQTRVRQGCLVWPRGYFSEIAIPLRSRLTISPTCPPCRWRWAPLLLLSTMPRPPTPTAAPPPAAASPPATAGGCLILVTEPESVVCEAPKTRPALRPPTASG